LDDFERQSAERKLLNVISIQSEQAA